MLWRKKDKIEFPVDYKIGDHKGHVYTSWYELPFNMYLKLLECNNSRERLMLLTGCKSEHLEDKQFRLKMESMTAWSNSDVVLGSSNSITFDDYTYVFPKDFTLLQQSYRQWSYLDACLTPVKRIQEIINKETTNDEPDATIIAEQTEKQSKEIIKVYPNIIAAYLNVAKGEEFKGDNVDDVANRLNDISCVDILKLGAFFLTASIMIKNMSASSKITQEYKEKIIQDNRKQRVTNIILMLGVWRLEFLDWLKNTDNHLTKSMGGMQKK
jgi:hypothetical protein